jgi:2-polyprenyl-3-methyl-5-hydroxy-6-metoxy-1,4-benzoquinol methylase
MYSEYERLNNIGVMSPYAQGIMSEVTRYSAELAIQYLCDPVLEVGPADGISTKVMVEHGLQPILLDGSKSVCEDLREKFPELQIVHSIFEDFNSEIKFKTVTFGHVLEHVLEPALILKHAHSLLDTGGRVWAAVPNANSLHRQAAVKIGMLKDTQSLNETDISVGHRRVFTMAEFEDLFVQSGFKIINRGGYFLKPLSNFQIENSWSQELFKAYLEMGEFFPEIAGEIWILAEKKT